MKKILHRWFIEAMSFMALGLFGSLIIGLIINTIAQYIPILSGFSAIGDAAQSVTGAAIGAAIAYGLKSPPLVIFSTLAVSQYAYDLGGAAASYIVALIVIELARLYQSKTKLDIIITPLLTLTIGLFSASFIGEAVGGVMTGLGDIIMFSTDQQPFVMGVLVSVVFGVTLTAPLSSAALALMLDLNGLAAASAVIGCCCHMVGLAAMSYKDNGISGVISIGVGTSMLQVPNILRNPFIIIPPVLSSAIIAPIMTVFFPMANNAAGAGMGTSGFVGQIMAIETMGLSVSTIVLISVFHIILPLIITLIFYKLFSHFGFIKAGDQVIRLGK